MPPFTPPLLQSLPPESLGRPANLGDSSSNDIEVIIHSGSGGSGDSGDSGDSNSGSSGSCGAFGSPCFAPMLNPYYPSTTLRTSCDLISPSTRPSTVPPAATIILRACVSVCGSDNWVPSSMVKSRSKLMTLLLENCFGTKCKIMGVSIVLALMDLFGCSLEPVQVTNTPKDESAVYLGSAPSHINCVIPPFTLDLFGDEFDDVEPGACQFIFCVYSVLRL